MTDTNACPMPIKKRGKSFSGEIHPNDVLKKLRVCFQTEKHRLLDNENTDMFNSKQKLVINLTIKGRSALFYQFVREGSTVRAMAHLNNVKKKITSAEIN